MLMDSSFVVRFLVSEDLTPLAKQSKTLWEAALISYKRAEEFELLGVLKMESKKDQAMGQNLTSVP